MMPCYNSAKFIDDSIKSVLAQTYRNFELIIIDDNSADDSLHIIKKYNDHRIRLITLKNNSGAGAARNEGIASALGRFIAFLDSDDLWRNNKLEQQINFMIDNNYPFTYTYYQKFSFKGSGKLVTSPLMVNYDQLVICNVIGCLTAIYDINKLGKHYMPLIRKRQDMGLWLNLLKKCQYAYCLPEVLADYRTDSGMTKNKLSAAISQWLFYRKELNLSIMKTFNLFVKYAYNGILRKYL
ncbi:glycosyltransferase family 2 protein [Morganella morganii]